MFAWIGRWWRQRQRSIDIDVLWPACRNNAHTIWEARAVFILHCKNDAAWTTDFSNEQIYAAADELN